MRFAECGNAAYQAGERRPDLAAVDARPILSRNKAAPEIKRISHLAKAHLVGVNAISHYAQLYLDMHTQFLIIRNCISDWVNETSHYAKLGQGM